MLENLGEDEEAEELSWQTLEVRERVLGGGHLSTVASKDRLARLLSNNGNYDESLRLYREVLEVRQRLLGSQHWLTEMTLGRLRMVEVFRREEMEDVESDSDPGTDNEECSR